MSIAVANVDHRSQAGFSVKRAALLNRHGGGRALLQERIKGAGEVELASAKRLRREILAKQHVRYRLRHPDGAYVNADLSGEVTGSIYAWIGYLHQLEAVRRLRPDLSEYRPVPVMPERRADIAVQVTIGFGRGVMG